MVILKENEDYIQNQSELKVRNCLKILEKPDYYATHDITIPIEDGTSQIDHVVVSKYGVFVIETKGHKGQIYGQEQEYQWTCINGGKRSLYNPLKQNNGHIKALIGLTGLSDSKFINIVIFSENPTFKTELPKNVLKFYEVIDYIKSFKTDILIQEEIIKTVGIMEFYRKERSKETLDEHIKFVKGKLNRTNNNKKSLETVSEAPLMVSRKQLSNYPPRINKISGQLKFIKIGFLIISIIFLANVFKNKQLNTTDITQTSIEKSLNALKDLTEHDIKDQVDQLPATTKEETNKATNIDQSDYLKNTIGLPSVDEYNKLSKSKGASCRIGKVNNVWQKVCD
jgi:hypothetical protein